MNRQHEVKVVSVEVNGPIGGQNPDKDVWTGSGVDQETLFRKHGREFYEQMLAPYFFPVTKEAEVRCLDPNLSGITGILFNEVQGLETSDELKYQVLGSQEGRFSSKYFRGEDGLRQIRELAEQIKQEVDVTNHPIFLAMREEVLAESLGPQTLGGSHGMAIAMYIAEGAKEGKTLEDYINRLAETPDEFKPGTHAAEGAVLPKVGCKLADEDDTILYRAGGALYLDENRRLSRLILGFEPDPQLEHQAFVGLARYNDPETKQTFTMTQEGVSTHRLAGLDILSRHGSEKEIVTRGTKYATHFLLNRFKDGPGHTFHKNLRGLDIMGLGVPDPPLAFSYDWWRSMDRSRDLAQGDEEMERVLRKIRALMAASALTVISDGSLIAAERLPKVEVA